MRWLARPMRCISRLGALRRADMDDEIDVAPVDAEVERRGADHGAQPVSAIAASTLRRWPTSSEPWCSAIGSVSSLMLQSAWKSDFGLAARVDEDSVVLWSRIAS
jgi:hypothetical protein